MKLKIFALIFAFFASEVVGNLKSFIDNFSGFNGLSFLRIGTCDPLRCPQIPKHYEELNCEPIIKDGDCCPTSFDCKHLDTRDDSKCYYKGKVLNDRDQVDSSMLGSACVGAAFCSSGSFVHAHIDCAEFFGPILQEGCIRQYSKDSCCSVGTVCGEEAKNLSTCVFEGKTYHEGERMFPSEFDCYKCFCTKDFEQKPVSINKDCFKANCNIELLEADSVKNKCVPVYPKDICCPYDWRCPSDDDAIIPGDRKSVNGTDLKCKFGKLEFEIGDTLSSGVNACSKCTCKIPPMLDCVFTPSC